jgi:diguanylate cyclase (GGDEF)-like protein
VIKYVVDFNMKIKYNKKLVPSYPSAKEPLFSEDTMEKKFPILIIEDDIVSRKLLEKKLTKEGYAVVTVENGIEALAKFNETFFPIVVSDWMMPELDGLGLCREIRKKEWEGYVFIILLTCKDSKDDIVSGLEAGADDYLTKPFHHAELIARINSGVRIVHLEQSLRSANEEIRLLSIKDQLTGCFNRSYFNERFPQELTRARRYRHPLSLIICDIDHFKNINDNYGHQAGDGVLKEFAASIMSSIRDRIDWMVRYGGEEFLIILPETDAGGTQILAERLRKRIAEKTINTGGHTISVTASFGSTSLYPDSEGELYTQESIIRTADALLYKAKESGRNRVFFGPVTL